MKHSLSILFVVVFLNVSWANQADGDTLFIQKHINTSKEQRVPLYSGQDVIIKINNEIHKRIKGKVDSIKNSSIYVINKEGASKTILFSDINYIKILNESPKKQRGRVMKNFGRASIAFSMGLFFNSIKKNNDDLAIGAIYLGIASSTIYEVGKSIHGKKMFIGESGTSSNIIHKNWSLSSLSMIPQEVVIEKTDNDVKSQEWKIKKNIHPRYSEISVALKSGQHVRIKENNKKTIKGKVTQIQDSSIHLVNKKGESETVVFNGIRHIKILNNSVKKRHLGGAMINVGAVFSSFFAWVGVGAYIGGDQDGVASALLGIASGSAVVYVVGRKIHGKKMYLDEKKRVFRTNWSIVKS